MRSLADGQQVPGLYWRLVAVWCKSEGCVTSGYSQGVLVQSSGIFFDAAGILAGCGFA